MWVWRAIGNTGLEIYLKTKDDGPDKAQREAMVSIHNVVGTNVFQMNSLLFQELQSFVNIFQAVDPHTTPRRSRLGRNRGIYQYFILT